MYQNLMINLKGMSPEEYAYLEQIMKPMDQKQAEMFMLHYSGKRKSPQDILLFTLLGFVIIAGVQRFVIGQIGMGLLYLFTFGLCFIGTIVDVINHKALAMEYNQRAAFETAQMVKIMNS